jgi:hypothetical protein
VNILQIGEIFIIVIENRIDLVPRSTSRRYYWTKRRGGLVNKEMKKMKRFKMKKGNLIIKLKIRSNVRKVNIWRQLLENPKKVKKA